MELIPPKTKLQIAAEYLISYSNLRRRIQKIGVSLPGGDLLPGWQKLIYENLGYPSGVNIAILSRGHGQKQHSAIIGGKVHGPKQY